MCVCGWVGGGGGGGTVLKLYLFTGRVHLNLSNFFEPIMCGVSHTYADDSCMIAYLPTY